MLGLSKLDGDAEGRHREHAAALYSRGRRGPRHLSGRHPTLLAIETAGSNCSAAVAAGSNLLASETLPLRHGHGEALLPMIERVMARIGLQPAQLDAVAAAVGPGGFTGIRVGLAAANGIALALGARLVGVTSFAAVAGRIGSSDEPLLIALDSRRADFYVQLFAPNAADPRAVLPDELADYVGGHARLIVAGDAAEAAATALAGRIRCTIVPNSAPDATGVAIVALRQLRADAVDAPVRPLYLRPPDVTLPKPLA